MAILLPGVPKEAEPMFKNQVVPMLKRLETGVIISKYIRTIGIGESRLEEKLAFMINGKNPTVALYAKDGEVLVRITASAKDKAAAEEMLDGAYKSIDSAVHNYIYGVDVDNIETAIVRQIAKRGENPRHGGKLYRRQFKRQNNKCKRCVGSFFPWRLHIYQPAKK